jgi:hypothetical protein
MTNASDEQEVHQLIQSIKLCEAEKRYDSMELFARELAHYAGCLRRR